ncbi:2-oxo-tetronate isomerase [Paraburkholderia saeva]|jgi:2-dehydrotetronate isomerase|uniref:2-oxo-tetronate isomerase n=1 Tax=Paraburkholderia saeva TaxID=2777537 RepID=A0A9N8X2P4_9BURK|nr:2-oxo-tetronate isomerase [Paraburkholderia saeva]CAG4890150.1 2-oxo-tetronate isomerase [Paraburkholderia saeva]CAG4912085.1 2-oxo-tetronate isomerase [Paraburkholderia saeva]
MPRFAANLTMMYREHAFPDRFRAAATDGFKGVEFHFPYDYPAAELAARLNASGLKQVLFNGPPGDLAKGDRGLASLPGREDEFRRSVDTALDYAQALGCKQIHLMAGIVAPDADPGQHRDVYLKNLAYGASQAAMHGVTVMIEPINTRDMPGYFLNRQHDARQICREVGAANLKVQFDFYHCQIVEGDLTVKLREMMPDIGHIQIASVPDRHEPDSGEINCGYILRLLDSLEYAGWVGCEYVPAGNTSDGLGWLRDWM